MVIHVFFNGMKAERAFRRYALPALTEDQHIFARLPSTSPAHAAMTLEAKVQAWCVVRKILSVRDAARGNWSALPRKST